MNAVPASQIGVERTFHEDEIIVSKTDLKGRITYANQVFLRIAGYTEKEVLGQPHNILRHPDMPRCVFKLLWDTIEAKREIFAYVINRGKNGDHYWVFAHITPTFDARRNIVGYHSTRRLPSPSSVTAIKPVYRMLLLEESKYPNKKEGMDASTALLLNTLRSKKLEYDEFVFAV
jgi:PAS domain S-box-containing protein